MGDFPPSAGVLLPGANLSSIGPQSQVGDVNLNANLAAASAAWPAANRAIYVPVLVERRCTVFQMWVYNGATANGNIDLGIYRFSGSRVVSLGSTAQSGTNTLQVGNITDTVLVPGVYYLALALSSATGTVFRTALTTLQLRFADAQEEASAFPLPTTKSGGDPSAAFLPVFGASLVSTI